MKALKAGWVLLLGLGSGPSYAKTLAECYQAAIRQSETAAVQKEAIEQAEATYRQAIGAVLPNISGTGTYLVQESVNNGVGGTIFPSTQPLVKLTAQQPLFQGFKEFSGLKQAKRLVHASEEDYKQAKTQLYYDVSTAFFTVLSLETDIKNLSEEIHLYEKRIGELRQFEKLGRARHSEVLTADSSRASLVAQLAQVRSNLAANREVLAFLTGFESSVTVEHDLANDPQSKPLTVYVAQIEQRPDVRADSMRSAAADSAVTVAEAGHWPTVTAQGNYYLKRFGTLSNVHWDFTLGVSLPIFSGGIVSAQVSQAVSKREQAESILNRTKRLALQQVKTFFSTFEFDRKQWDLYQEATKLSEANYKQQTNEYRLGLVKNVDVLLALASFQETKRSQDRTRYLVELDLEKLEASAAMRTQ